MEQLDDRVAGLADREDRVEGAILDVAGAQDQAMRVHQRADERDHPAAIVEARGAVVDVPEPADRGMIVEPVGDGLLAGQEIAPGDPAARMIFDMDLAPIGRPAAYLDPLAAGAQGGGRAQPVVDRVADDLDRHRLRRRLGLRGRPGLGRGEGQGDQKHANKTPLPAGIGREAARSNRGRAVKLWLAPARAGAYIAADAGRSVKGRPILFLEDQLAQPLMPHATASWLVDNSSLTFQQIAEFCGLHILEVQAIADDTAATKLTGRDPLRSGELTQEEIDRGQNDPDYKLQMHREPDQAVRTKGPRYTPVSKRQDKPDGVAWLIRNHPNLTDGQIGKLIGTTRSTIQAIRERSHWNIANIQPKDPVTLGLTSQRELDAAVAKAAKAAGAEAPRDLRFDEDREALIEELRAEREAHAREAEAALAAESGEGAPAPDLNADTLFKS